MAETEVRTTAGMVRGRWENAVAVFRGIPYAQPPIGSRRFAAPVPLKSWEGVRGALEFGSPVPQPGCTSLSASVSSGVSAADWLTLNVWSPDLGPARLPVMVWIHGGKYLEGSACNPHQDGTTLAAAGVVVVSMNYRLGAEGFARIAGAPDNRGTLDQAAALRWVHPNVAAFGDEPGNVTVFGQSAGAGCIAALLAMPIAAGLFHRAIAQSVPGTYFSEQLAAAVSAAIAAELGMRPTAAELALIAPCVLVDATTAVIKKMPTFGDSWGPMALTPTPFSPIVGGAALSQTPWSALANGAGRDIQLLVGHTRDEYSLFNTWRSHEVTHEQVSATLERLMPASDSTDGYCANYPDASLAQLYELMNSDWLFRMPSQRLADAQSAGNGTERRGSMNCAGVSTRSKAHRIVSMSCWCSERSPWTIYVVTNPRSRTQRTRLCESPTICAPTG